MKLKDAPMLAKNANQAASRREERMEAEFSNVNDAPPSSRAGSDSPVNSQRRGAPRFKVELDVSLGSDHNFYVGFVENMSVGGVFIATHMLRAVGDVFELSVHLPNSEEVVQGLGEVRWIREYSERSNVPPGMGVRFIRLEPGSAEKIQEFLARREPMFYDDE
ncbi:MAG TPA: TIGR02266 family protein [Polyangiaceae bacterium]